MKNIVQAPKYSCCNFLIQASYSTMSSKLNPLTAPFVPSTSLPAAGGAGGVNSTNTYLLPDPECELFTPIPEPDKTVLEYPFSFIADLGKKACYYEYDINDFSKGLLDEEKCDAGNFPKNIVEFYWLHEGHNDEEPWYCLCKLDNGNYAYYTAWCDYTGFDCQGGMELIVSKDLNRLFNQGLGKKERELYMKDKAIPQRKVIVTYTPIPDTTKEWVQPIPIIPEAKPAAKASRAFIRIWNNGKELILNLDCVNGLEMDELEFAISGLTAQFLTPKPKPGDKPIKPKKKFYTINICAGPYVYDIDDFFKKRFGNPDKKWELRMRNPGGSGGIRKWGKLEVSFILC